MKKILPILTLLLTLPIGATAAVIEIQNPLTAPDFETIVANLIDFVFKIAIVLAPLMIVIGGVMFVTSGGSAERIATARMLIIWTAVGFLIIMLAKGLYAILESILGVK